MDDVATLRADAIKQGLTEIEKASQLVREATGAKDIYATIDEFLPVGVSSLRLLEEKLNDPDLAYQEVLELRDRWVDGWKNQFSKFLRIKNANAQLAAELAERKKKPGAARRR